MERLQVCTAPITVVAIAMVHLDAVVMVGRTAYNSASGRVAL
jgi:hypothetical protein